MKELVKFVVGIIISLMMVMGAVNHNSTTVNASSVNQSTGVHTCMVGTNC